MGTATEQSATLRRQVEELRELIRGSVTTIKTKDQARAKIRDAVAKSGKTIAIAARADLGTPENGPPAAF